MIGKLFAEIIERNADAYFTKKVREFKGKVIGSNNDSELFGEVNDVNGFRFLNFKILGSLNVHVYKGCKIIFENDHQALETESDTQEIFSDYSKKLGIGITSIDLDLEDAEAKLRSSAFNTIRFQIEKQTLFFNINSHLLTEVLDNPVEPDNTKLGNESMDPFLQGE